MKHPDCPFEYPHNAHAHWAGRPEGEPEATEPDFECAGYTEDEFEADVASILDSLEEDDPLP